MQDSVNKNNGSGSSARGNWILHASILKQKEQYHIPQLCIKGTLNFFCLIVFFVMFNLYFPGPEYPVLAATKFKRNITGNGIWSIRRFYLNGAWYKKTRMIARKRIVFTRVARMRNSPRKTEKSVEFASCLRWTFLAVPQYGKGKKLRWNLKTLGNWGIFLFYSFFSFISQYFSL